MELLNLKTYEDWKRQEKNNCKVRRKWETGTVWMISSLVLQNVCLWRLLPLRSPRSVGSAFIFPESVHSVEQVTLPREESQSFKLTRIVVLRIFNDFCLSELINCIKRGSASLLPAEIFSSGKHAYTFWKMLNLFTGTMTNSHT